MSQQVGQPGLTEEHRQDADAAYQILGVLQKYAPTGAEQSFLADQYNKIYAQSEGNSRRVLIVFTGMLLDGLRYGNWPWVVAALSSNPTQSNS